MSSRSIRSPQRSPNDEFLRFTSSVGFDQRLWRYDIAGSMAHAHALAKVEVLSEDELKQVTQALRSIADAISKGSVRFDPALEDVHMNIEKLLVDAVGDPGKKLHSGRSRNDQVSLDLRLMVREALKDTSALVVRLQEELVEKARTASGMILPGYTHLQHAQPVLLSHHLLAHFWKLQRDFDRMSDCFKRTDISPLGSGALAGTGFKIDRTVASKLLAMDGVTENSLDSVSDRDFAAETAFALSLLMVHLSSFSEELVLWSSSEFGFVKLPKQLSSGSSMMPQKRNPDLPELVRGKSGRTIGDLVTILTLLKSLPLAYNRDLQEDKEPLFDAIDTAQASLDALTSFLRAASFDRVRMRKSAEVGLMTATDLADFLTTTGLPFRTAHGLVKEIAEKSDGDERRFRQLADKVIREQLKDFRTSDLQLLSIEKAIERRSTEGGTSQEAVSRQMEKAKTKVRQNKKTVSDMTAKTAVIDGLIG